MALGQNTQVIGGFLSSVIQQYADAKTKPGFKTSEFWLSVLTSAAALAPGVVPAPWGPIVAMVTTLGYTLARMFVKVNIPTVGGAEGTTTTTTTQQSTSVDKTFPPGRM
jgi:hypothetical protein